MAPNTSVRQQSQRGRLRKSLLGGLLLGAVVLGAIGIMAWSWSASSGETNDPNVLVNLTSMLGKQGPAFALTDGDGKEHRVSPGHGGKYVLIFHMGSA